MLAPPVYFFFSSRRGDTRCSRDWSSDVCSSDLSSGANITVGYGYGYAGGFYGYYNGGWETVTNAPQKINGPTWTLSETRLFDAKNGVLAWTGVVDTRETDDLGKALTAYVGMIFDAMVRD